MSRLAKIDVDVGIHIGTANGAHVRTTEGMHRKAEVPAAHGARRAQAVLCDLLLLGRRARCASSIKRCKASVPLDLLEVARMDQVAGKHRSHSDLQREDILSSSLETSPQRRRLKRIVDAPSEAAASGPHRSFDQSAHCKQVAPTASLRRTLQAQYHPTRRGLSSLPMFLSRSSPFCPSPPASALCRYVANGGAPWPCAL